MVPSGLENIFGALSVGILAITLLSLWRWHVAGPSRSFKGWILRSVPKGASPTILTAEGVLLVVGCFALGVVLQDVTDRLMDDSTDNPLVEAPVYLLGDEWERRLGVIVEAPSARSLSRYRLGSDQSEPDQTERDGPRYGLSPLGRSVFVRSRRSIRPLFDELTLNKVKGFLNDPIAVLNRNRRDPRPHEKDLGAATTATNTVYYEAKNWAYSQPTYFSELQSIQQRIDFSRSVFILTFYACVLLLLALAVQAPCVWLCKSCHKCPDDQQAATGTIAVRLLVRLAAKWRERPVWDLVRHTFRILVRLLLVCMLSWYGYRHSDEQFNLRAFGYYVSHLAREDAGQPR